MAYLGERSDDGYVKVLFISDTHWYEDWWDEVKSLASKVKADLGIICSGDSAIPKRIWILAKFPVVHFLHTARVISFFPFAVLSAVFFIMGYAFIILISFMVLWLAFVFLSLLGTSTGLWNWDHSKVLDWMKKEATMLVTEVSDTTPSLGKTTPTKLG